MPDDDIDKLTYDYDIYDSDDSDDYSYYDSYYYFSHPNTTFELRKNIRNKLKFVNCTCSVLEYSYNNFNDVCFNLIFLSFQLSFFISIE